MDLIGLIDNKTFLVGVSWYDLRCLMVKSRLCELLLAVYRQTGRVHIVGEEPKT